MKCLLLLSAGLQLFLSIAYSQGLETLQQQLESARFSQEKIYALHYLAVYYTNTLGKDSMADMYGDQQIAFAKQTGDNELIALAYFLEGERLIKMVPSEKRFARAKVYLYRTIEIAQQHNLPFYGASAYIALSRPFYFSFEIDGNKALVLAQNAVKLSKAISNDSLLSLSFTYMAVAYRHKNDNLAAYRAYQQALKTAERLQDPYPLAYCYFSLGHFFQSLGELNKAVAYFSKAEQSMEQKKSPSHNDLNDLYWIRQALSNVYVEIGDEQKAKAYIDRYAKQAISYNMPEFYKLEPLIQNVFMNVGLGHFEKTRELYWNPDVERIYLAVDYRFGYYSQRALVFQKTKQFDSAAIYYERAFKNADKDALSQFHNSYGIFLLEKGNIPPAIHYLELAKTKFEEQNNLEALISAYQNLDSVYYLAGNSKQAYKYNKLYHYYKDSLRQLSKQKELALLEVEQEQRKMEQQRLTDQADAEYKNRIRMYVFSGGLLLLLVIAGILYRNNLQKQKANTVLQQQKAKTDRALEELKDTQAQLIQSEKMASLGELTAGIAHEIQNPLNFVNNFSETNAELIEELKQEVKAGNIQEILQIADDLKENEQKVTHHGRRAEAIVKSMLEHSRSSKGEKQLTDINALIDEYLRLAYHGFRAKDKNFNATIGTNFDQGIGKTNIVPQEIGRVLLNIFNNAFYAVAEKKKQGIEGYEPTVTVSSKKTNDKMEITVNDNGNGIPQHLIDKIFQPFYTTKPTGQGTGLGLSLSYDIVKAHGGELKIESQVREGATFIVKLPV
jgi:two-component system, NtrC family, sensor kinase